MHILYVLRHAKSSWDDPPLDDHERPLAPRGRAAVKLLAEHVRVNGIAPEEVLCSSARRTLETLEGVLPGHQALIEPELYRASAQEVLERLRRVPDHVNSLMLVGHNPAMHALVLGLVGPVDADGEMEAVRRKFPTGALATLTFACSWSELAPARAELTAYVRPKGLEHRD